MLLEFLGTPIKTKLNTDCSALGSMHRAQTPAWHAAQQEFNDLVSHSAWSEACPSSWVLHWNNIATRLLAFGKWTKQKTTTVCQARGYSIQIELEGSNMASPFRETGKRYAPSFLISGDSILKTLKHSCVHLARKPTKREPGAALLLKFLGTPIETKLKLAALHWEACTDQELGCQARGYSI